MSKVVLIAGGTGLIGQEISGFLMSQGYTVRILSRSSKQSEITSVTYYQWNPDSKKPQIDLEAFDGVHAVINLSGSSILNKRWTLKRKESLYRSRVDTSGYLCEIMNGLETPPTYFIQASAMGYFGDRGDELLTESSAPGNTFLAKLCVDWEKVSEHLTPKTKRIILRLGLYFSPKGGVFSISHKLAKFGLNTSFGPGNQYVNYTHRDELNALVEQLLSGQSESGIYHAVGAKAITLDEMMNAISKQTAFPLWLPRIPAWLLRAVLGERADSLLHSTRVETKKEVVRHSLMFSSVEEALKAF